MFPHAEQHVSSAMTGNAQTARRRCLPRWSSALVCPLGCPLRACRVGLAGGPVRARAGWAAPTLGRAKQRHGGVLLIVAALASYGVAINLARPLQQRNGALPVVWRALAGSARAHGASGLCQGCSTPCWTVRWPRLCMLALGYAWHRLSPTCWSRSPPAESAQRARRRRRSSCRRWRWCLGSWCATKRSPRLPCLVGRCASQERGW